MSVPDAFEVCGTLSGSQTGCFLCFRRVNGTIHSALLGIFGSADLAAICALSELPKLTFLFFFIATSISYRQLPYLFKGCDPCDCALGFGRLVEQSPRCAVIDVLKVVMSSTATPTLPKVATLLEQPAQQEQSQPAPAQTPQAQISPSSEPPQKKKRPRAAQACDRCRAKKYKCDESFPCFYCRKHGYDCIYQGNTPRAWERTVNSSYVESLERRVQELEARTGGETQSYSPNPASALSPTASTAHLQQFQPDTLYAPLSTREEQQRGPGEQGPGLATKYGPIAGSPGYRASPSTSNVSKVRARESDVSRTRLPPASGERETSHGTPPETEIRDVNPYTKVCIRFTLGASIKLTLLELGVLRSKLNSVSSRQSAEQDTFIITRTITISCVAPA